MTTSTVVRPGHLPEASRPAVPAAVDTTAPGPHRSPRLRRPWWRLWIRSAPRRPVGEFRRTTLQRLLALLEAARQELAAGWVQGGWWSVSPGGGRRTALSGVAAGAAPPESVRAVCLVGALVRAGSGQGTDSELGRAIGVVHDALWESRGHPAARPGPNPPVVPSPQTRLAQIQTLTRWNDAQGRTSDEVFAILDLAISRTIQSLAASPAPPGSCLSLRDQEADCGLSVS
jgi:hypothetical protein